MNKIFNFLLLASLFISIISCSGADVEEPSVITDNEGVVVELDWETNSDNPIKDADLDLFIGRSVNYENSDFASTEVFYFEEIILDDVISDNTYNVFVKNYSGNTRVDYTIRVYGLNDSQREFTYNGYFLANDNINVHELIKIQKSGSTYTIIN
ncbi:hypothetical protein [Marinigracilibium pacificum]|uniref:Fibronectin type-III domain-containing protein n=1 Tax=Marinigracilibium pacificum TaxID=2729599 RepID=A0A848J1R0_9BACT|nr:hypothetical protein [Marinigracilibium pacificum]NMM48249.1 hypothetical protein [Marinigracilibium pacificum]